MPRLMDVLTLERVEEDLFRSNLVLDETSKLYGGQVAAQALMAAGATVGPERCPHSFHGYFLREGNSALPTVFRVYRDRDGRSFSSRRVVAIQQGVVILNASVSFHVPEAGPDLQLEQRPTGVRLETTLSVEVTRLFGIELCLPEGPSEHPRLPTRFAVRVAEPIGDRALLQAGAMLYVSDLSTGLSPLHSDVASSSSSLDHAVWFHRPVDLDAWTLLDLVPVSVSAGRGWYRGSFFDAVGVLVASLTQETLFRPHRPGAAGPLTKDA